MSSSPGSTGSDAPQSERSDFGIAVSVQSEHGLLHGSLVIQPGARGIIVLVHDARWLDARDDALSGIFHDAGLSTLSLDLIARQEEHFPDIHHNVSLMARRLLDFLDLIKLRMQLGELPTLPFGLFAANATTPVAVRVAALRDHDIAAVVCRGGLIDLAGVLYLRSLEAPLLVLADETDAQHIASCHRALQQVHCAKELQLIPEISTDATAHGRAKAACAASEWFCRYIAQTSCDLH